MENNDRIKYKGAVVLVQGEDEKVYHVAISHKVIREMLIKEQEKGVLKFSDAITDYTKIMKIDFNIE